MAWIAIVPPSPRHPHERYQVRYQDGKRQRSAGIYPTLRRAEAERRAIERAGRQPLHQLTEPDPGKARTLFGEYVTTKWWPAWKDQHPASEYGTRKKVEKRILPTFGDIPLGMLDASTIGRWKAAMVAEGLRPRTVNTYLALLGTILNAAVDDDYLTHSPPTQERRWPHRRHPQPARAAPRGLAAARTARPARRCDRPRYRALILVAALTGMRWVNSLRCAGTTPASTSPWTTARCVGRGGCGSPGRSATPGGPAVGWRRAPRPRPASV